MRKTAIAFAEMKLSLVQTLIATAITKLSLAQTVIATAITKLSLAQTLIATAITKLSLAQTVIATAKMKLSLAQTSIATAITKLSLRQWGFVNRDRTFVHLEDPFTSLAMKTLPTKQRAGSKCEGSLCALYMILFHVRYTHNLNRKDNCECDNIQ